jgi:hypothetical protein
LVGGLEVRSNRPVPTDYRLSPPLALRVMGVLLAVTGGLVVLLTVAVGVLDLPSALLVVGVALAVLTLLAGGIVLARRPSVVRLDDTGYRVRLVRGAGVKQARWLDVEDVVATTVGGERCVVLRLRDGRTTTVPVRMLAGRPEVFVKDLQGYLDRGHGYRRIN